MKDLKAQHIELYLHDENAEQYLSYGNRKASRKQLLKAWEVGYDSMMKYRNKGSKYKEPQRAMFVHHVLPKYMEIQSGKTVTLYRGVQIDLDEPTSIGYLMENLLGVTCWSLNYWVASMYANTDVNDFPNHTGFIMSAEFSMKDVNLFYSACQEGIWMGIGCMRRHGANDEVCVISPDYYDHNVRIRPCKRAGVRLLNESGLYGYSGKRITTMEYLFRFAVNEQQQENRRREYRKLVRWLTEPKKKGRG